LIFLPLCSAGIYYGKYILNTNATQSKKREEQGNLLIAFGSIGIGCGIIGILLLIFSNLNKMAIMAIIVIIFTCLFFTVIATSVTQ
jgi:hypothetical protein